MSDNMDWASNICAHCGRAVASGRASSLEDGSGESRGSGDSGSKPPDKAQALYSFSSRRCCRFLSRRLFCFGVHGACQRTACTDQFEETVFANVGAGLPSGAGVPTERKLYFALRAIGNVAVGHWSICTGTAAVPAVHQGEQQAIGRCSNAPLTPTRNPHHRCTQARRGNCGMGRGHWGIGASVQAPPQPPHCIRESNRPSADVQMPL